jgi:hypothetical protein
MPSVMDTIRFRDKLMRMNVSMRNQVISESIAWLESEERPKCKPEQIPHLIQFETEFQRLLNQQEIPETWFTMTAQTYSRFPFYANLLKRLL